MLTPKTPQEKLTVFIPAPLKARLRHIAKVNGRTLRTTIMHLIEEAEDPQETKKAYAALDALFPAEEFTE